MALSRSSSFFSLSSCSSAGTELTFDLDFNEVENCTDLDDLLSGARSFVRVDDDSDGEGEGGETPTVPSAPLDEYCFCLMRYTVVAVDGKMSDPRSIYSVESDRNRTGLVVKSLSGFHDGVCSLVGCLKKYYRFRLGRFMVCPSVVSVFRLRPDGTLVSGCSFANSVLSSMLSDSGEGVKGVVTAPPKVTCLPLSVVRPDGVSNGIVASFLSSSSGLWDRCKEDLKLITADCLLTKRVWGLGRLGFFRRFEIWDGDEEGGEGCSVWYGGLADRETLLKVLDSLGFTLSASVGGGSTRCTGT